MNANHRDGIVFLGMGVVILMGVINALRKGEYVSRLYFVRKENRPARFYLDLGMEAFVAMIVIVIGGVLFFAE
jgi:hypothetical protein